MNQNINRYQNGTEELKNTGVFVDKMQAQLTILEPQLVKSTQETKILMENLNQNQGEVKEESKVVAI